MRMLCYCASTRLKRRNPVAELPKAPFSRGISVAHKGLKWRACHPEGLRYAPHPRYGMSPFGLVVASECYVTVAALSVAIDTGTCRIQSSNSENATPTESIRITEKL
jgi:hypothetical protein